MVARMLPGHCYVEVVMSVVGCSWGLLGYSYVVARVLCVDSRTLVVGCYDV